MPDSQPPTTHEGGVNFEHWSHVNFRADQVAVAGHNIIYHPKPVIRTCPIPESRPLFAGREADLDAILAKLRHGNDVAITATVLHGGGGIGKTTLAKVVAHDAYTKKMVRAVLWINVNQNPDLTTLLLQWAKQADPTFDPTRQLLTVEIVRGLLSNLIDQTCNTCEGNRVLVVLDNVWIDGKAVVEKLRAAVPTNSVVLLTTRREDLAIHLKIPHRHHLGYLDPKAATEFLSAYLPDADRDGLEQLAGALGGFPLAMQLAARRVELVAGDSGMNQSRALSKVLPNYINGIPASHTFADLHFEEGEHPEDNLTLSLSFSYNDLAPDDQRRFRQLGMLPLDADFDLPLLGELWEIADSHTVQEYCRPLRLVALLSSTDVEDWYQQHRLLRAYAFALLRMTDEAESTMHQGMEVLNRNGRRWSLRGDKSRALGLYERVLVLAQMLENKQWQSIAFNNIGVMWSDLGEHQRALDFLNQALLLRRAVGDNAGEASTLHGIGRVWLQLGEHQQALDFFNQALPLTRTIGDRDIEAHTLHGIGRVWLQLGEHQQALDFFNQALPLMRVAGYKDGEAIVRLGMGTAWSQLGEHQQALDFFNQALPHMCVAGYKDGEAIVRLGMGTAWLQLGEHQRALDFLNQYISLQSNVGDKDDESIILLVIGLLWLQSGEHRQALDFFNQALPLTRTIGNRDIEAHTLHGIGRVWYALEEHQQALDFFNQALFLRRTVGDRKGEANTLHDIGIVWSNLGEHQQALDFFNQALLLRRTVGDRTGEANTLHDIGRVWHALGEHQQALDFFNQALPLQRTVGDRTGEANTLHDIGRVWHALGEHQQALDFFNQALPLQRTVGDKAGEAVTFFNIGKVFAEWDGIEQAIALLVRCIELEEQVQRSDLDHLWHALTELQQGKKEVSPLAPLLAPLPEEEE